jgi:hypothetical protein
MLAPEKIALTNATAVDTVGFGLDLECGFWVLEFAVRV